MAWIIKNGIRKVLLLTIPSPYLIMSLQINTSMYETRCMPFVNLNVKYKRTDALSLWHQQYSTTVDIHGPLQARGETRCPGGVSVSCLARAPAMNACDTTKVYIWRFDTGFGPTLYRKCHSHNTPGKRHNNTWVEPLATVLHMYQLQTAKGTTSTIM